jgi:glycosyltransferase involved in cell wall biosynthesis
MKCNLGKNKFDACILVWNIDAPGGMERQAWRLAKELAKRDVKVTIISSLFVDRFNLNTTPWQKHTKAGVNVYRIPLKLWKYVTSIIFYIISLCLMIKLRKKYDVIYGVQLYSYGAIASLAGKLLHKPVVVKIACGGYCGDISMFSKLPLGRLTKRFAMWADAYVSLSRQIDKELRNAGFNKGEIVHIPNGVDTSVFYPAGSIEEKTELRTKLLLPNKKIVIFIGRLDLQKRADLLIEVFKELHKVYDGAHLVIIGDGPERKKLEEMADENILIKGIVSNVEEYLRASDLLVLPSLAEGMSNVILEAMATGLSVVTTNVSSNPEIIDNGINGILLDINDKSGLKENILRLLNDDIFNNELGQNAKAKIDKNFSIGIVAEKYIELFQYLLSRRTK